MKKICILFCLCIICGYSVVFAEQNISVNLNWGETYSEIKEKYPLIYNNHLDDEDSNTYWLKLNEPYLNGKKVVDGKILIYLKENKLYRIKVDFVDGTELIVQDKTIKKMKEIGENLYWGMSFAQVSKLYELKYKEHDESENASVYYLTLPEKNFKRSVLKSNKILAYFWNNQLYKIMAEKEDGTEIILQDDGLLKKAKIQGDLNIKRKAHEEVVKKINKEIEKEIETSLNKINYVKLIPGLYWGESINDIVLDYAVKYVEYYRDENALVYEMDFQNPYTKKDRDYNDFINTYQQITEKIRLYLWNNQLYKIEMKYNDVEQVVSDKTLLNRAIVDGQTLKLGGTLLKPNHRNILTDVKNDKLYMYWGQSSEELFKIYELSRGGIIWDTISINSIDLDNGKENSSSIIVMFSNNHLYKILLCANKNLKEQQKDFVYVKNYLEKKFGKPSVYKKDIWLWQDVTIPVDKSEEDSLQALLNEEIVRSLQ
ncbi:Uncharacterised protein [Megamonas hypermegale]|uniref:Uncharacterized protein n=1 Tax=Megamonas hypermegale TaxID=158847 RepID=A0A239TV60_9FIRM|nr:Uncharacterised protein [Megamonas hypermegale]